jgi:Helicase conserved C-terminal domain
VMVRRLKADLKALEGTGDFPVREVVRLEVGGEAGGGLPEVQLSAMLAQYTELVTAMPKGAGAGAGKGKQRSFALVNLQKRLLSSVAAFYRTLQVHAKSAALPAASSVIAYTLDDDVALDDGGVVDEETSDAAEAAQVQAASEGILRLAEAPSSRAQAADLLQNMLQLAGKHAERKDAKVEALLAWIREHQCAGVGLAEDARQGAKWQRTRVIVFTEYADTLRYLKGALEAATDGTFLAEGRIETFTGSLNDEGRQEVQRKFNSDPDSEPVRILLATDAAREGLNLQAFCADLFHFDIPWNPARMEQRNGRIDRTLQPAPSVRCHYFYYPARPEDRVLDTLVRKVGVITRELGSLSAVVLGRMDSALQKGISAQTAALLESVEAEAGAGSTGRRKKAVTDELEQVRGATQLAKDLAADRAALSKSSAWTDVTADALRACVDQGLALAGAPPLLPVPGKPGFYQVPAVMERGGALADAWAATLDSLRVPRAQNELLWDWRKKPILPVVFEPPPSLADGQVHLHLAHPFVMRVLSRFRAQGFSAHDLSRVTLVQSKHAEARVIVFGRLSLFGEGATRLHDEVVAVIADWVPEDNARHLQRYEEARESGVLQELEGLWTRAVSIPKRQQQGMLQHADADFRALWAELAIEADARTGQAEQALSARGLEEAAALTQILEDQFRALTSKTQLSLEAAGGCDLKLLSEAEKRQLRLDGEEKARRLTAIAEEKKSEPEQIRKLYEVVRRRLSPIGMVYLAGAY